jgi:hypothetical protein
LFALRHTPRPPEAFFTIIVIQTTIDQTHTHPTIYRRVIRVVVGFRLLLALLLVEMDDGGTAGEMITKGSSSKQQAAAAAGRRRKQAFATPPFVCSIATGWGDLVDIRQ